jgi:glycosyltransferase involved in cell wall biosynthesis
MILAYEACWSGVAHAATNSGILQAVAHAFPGQAIRVLADPSHLHELRQDALLATCPDIGFVAAPLSPHYRYRTAIVSVRRFARELCNLAAALRRAPPGEPVLLLLLSATPTAIFAATALARLARRKCAVQVVLHGNLNDAQGWRPRNPLLRAFDLKAALDRARARFLVLEPSIRGELAKLSPRGAARTDVLPHPVVAAEIAAVTPPPPPPPLQVGFVGSAMAQKGFDTYLAIARDFRARHGARVAFHLVGLAGQDADPAAFAPLAHPVAPGHLPREQFVARLAALHYVMLPFRPGYYTFSASGGLLDAITWLKPVIATRLPIIADLFAEYGEIGVLCDDEAALRAALDTALAEGLGTRYQNWVAALRRLRASRMPQALARHYRAVMDTHFAGLLG